MCYKYCLSYNIDLIISNGNSNLWTVFLSWCLAYSLPAPSMSVKNECALNTASLISINQNETIMATDNFYLTLPSYSSLRSFSNNMLFYYITALKRPIELEADWKIALVSMQHSTRWANIGPDYCRFHVKIKAENGEKWVFPRPLWKQRNIVKA